MYSPTGLFDSTVSTSVGSTVVSMLNSSLSQKLISQSGIQDFDYLSSPLVSSGQDIGTVVNGEIHMDVTPSEISSQVSSDTLMIPIVIMIIIMMVGSIVISSMGSEKENKTLETLLTMPIKRTTIVSGKIVAAAIVGLVYGLAYMAGMSIYMGSMTGSIGSGVDLAALGEAADGTMELTADGEVIASIGLLYNIAAAEQDPNEIDGFENYYGVDSMLTNSWATNKETGCTIDLTLTSEEGKVFDGEYALSFAYNETANGWAGATISKEVDWSDCDALQFYTIPDGNNQKVVIQITANGKAYEAYLNLYEEYAANDGTVPVKVTIPFTDFVERDTPGNPAGGLAQDKTSVTSFGLWVNAIPGSDAIGEDGMVSGTIIYDKITAVSAGVTEAVFEEVKAEDPDDPNPDTPDPDDPNPDDQDPQKPGTGSDGNDDPASGADSGNDAKKPSSDENKAAQTGDDGNCMPYAAGVLAAGIAAAGTAVYRRRMK